MPVLSENAEKLYEYFKQNYISFGYLYSGAIAVSSASEHAWFHDSALEELLNSNLIEDRFQDGLVYELTVQERHQLIEQYHLAEKWNQGSAKIFCPNDEIFNVKENLCKGASLEEKLNLAKEKISIYTHGREDIEFSGLTR